MSNGVEVAVSLNLKRRSDEPAVVLDARNGARLPHDAFETRVAIFEDRSVGWFFRVADTIASDGSAGYVILQIAASQIEAIQQFRKGESSKNKSADFFVAGLMETFAEAKPEHAPLLRNFYHAVRCGLFHDGMTRTGVVISQGFEFAFAVVGDQANQQIQINPWRFIAAVRANLNDYVAKLRDPSNVELRRAFDARWALNA